MTKKINQEINLCIDEDTVHTVDPATALDTVDAHPMVAHVATHHDIETQFDTDLVDDASTTLDNDSKVNLLGGIDAPFSLPLINKR